MVIQDELQGGMNVVFQQSVALTTINIDDASKVCTIFKKKKFTALGVELFWRGVFTLIQKTAIESHYCREMPM